jgi:hypothetical protein
MTAAPDQLRERIVGALQHAIDGLDEGYAAPLRSQLRVENDSYDAAALCLGLGSIAGAEAKTTPCALTLGLLEEMGRVFMGLEDGSSISGVWGMPRTLNAADGLYALAQHLLQTAEALDEAEKLAALSIFHDAARTFSEALQAWSAGGAAGLQKAARSLYPAAASFASLCGGFEDSVRVGMLALAQEAADAPPDLAATLARASGLLLPKA